MAVLEVVVDGRALAATGVGVVDFLALGVMVEEMGMVMAVAANAITVANLGTEPGNVIAPTGALAAVMGVLSVEMSGTELGIVFKLTESMAMVAVAVVAIAISVVCLDIYLRIVLDRVAVLVLAITVVRKVTWLGTALREVEELMVAAVEAVEVGLPLDLVRVGVLAKCASTVGKKVTLPENAVTSKLEEGVEKDR